MALSLQVALAWACSAELSLVQLPDSTSAVCNDGSPYAYYLEKSATSSPNWIFFQEGGSYCWDQVSCNERRSTNSNLMTSKGLKDTIVITKGIVSDSTAANPYYADWNKVQLPYCTSDAFSGTMESTSYGVSFLGSRIVPEVVADLLEVHGLLDSIETIVVYSGSSAGAVGIYPNLDHLANELLPLSRVVGVVDSGKAYGVALSLSLSLSLSLCDSLHPLLPANPSLVPPPSLSLSRVVS